MEIEHDDKYQIRVTLQKIVEPTYERSLYMSLPNGLTVILDNYDMTKLVLGKKYCIILYDYSPISQSDIRVMKFEYTYYNPLEKCGKPIQQNDLYYMKHKDTLVHHIRKVYGTVEKYSMGVVWITSEYPVILMGTSIQQSFNEGHIKVGDHICAEKLEMRCKIITIGDVIDLV